MRGATPRSTGWSCRCAPFQSTHPCAGCDVARIMSEHSFDVISIHAPLCGVRRRVCRRHTIICSISIHAPLCGVRPGDSAFISAVNGFQSTHPCAGCDMFCHRRGSHRRISIHAPLCGVRRSEVNGNGKVIGISIHAPLCGVRPSLSPVAPATILFQSTHPCAGCDSRSIASCTESSKFQSTHPCAGCDDRWSA